MKPHLFAAAVSVAVVTLSAAGAPAGAAANLQIGVRFQGRLRTYLLHVPPQSGGALVLAFHGGGQTALEQQTLGAFNAIADRDGVLVAYPQGIERSWADGRGTTKADRAGVDDVAFAKAVVEDVATRQPVDRARVYATGASNGGIFVNRLACDAADTFAAVAPVIGTIASALASRCHPSVPVPIVGIQGVSDPVVPFGGGEVGGTLDGAAAGGRVEGSRATQELWRTLNGCAATVAATAMPTIVRDGTFVTRRAYGGCRADVVWYEIAGGGHRWPMRRSERPMVERAVERLLGASSQNIDATEVIWAFFAAHARGRA
ncbi:MAG TPA: PHB depolymerase family esterase [Vicinamibacterales bacterium]|nr:PHB depolymerase family esterase [Vicinamibacterales bacterium]